MNKQIQSQALKLHTVNLLGISVAAVDADRVVDFCEEHILDRSNILLGMLNVAKVVNSRKNKQLYKSLDDADIIVADGQGIVWLSKLMGDPLPERVTGIDIMYRLLERANDKYYSVYLLGAKKEVIEKVVEYVREQYPNLRVAGYRDGYFTENDEEAIATEIKDSLTDILFIAISSPKKEFFLSKWRKYMNVPVCHGVGGSFDVAAGITKRAPRWMQDCGLEWFYRLCQEPKRMWKRYLITNTIFFFLAIKSVLQIKLKR